MNHTTGRALALVAGCLATAGALAILLQDAIASNTWRLEHGLIPVLMAVQILTAHSVITAIRARRAISVLGFAVVAIVATWGVLYTSVGKQSKVSAEATAQAQDTNEKRADALKRLSVNQGMLDGARAKMAAECASGKGARCKGIQATIDVYQDAVSGNRAELDRIGPARPVGASADKMAELIAVITGRDHASVKRLLLLIEPFTYATIFELAALVSFGFAFGHRSIQPARIDTMQTSFSVETVEPIDPNGGNRRRKPTYTKRAAEADIIQLFRDGKPIPTQDTLANRWGVGKGTVSKWVSDFERSGLIRRETIGRCKSVRPQLKVA